MIKASNITIPIIVIGLKGEEKVKLLLPSKALLILKSTKKEELTFLGETELNISIQKLVDIAITHKDFFKALDIAIDSEPTGRWIKTLIKKAGLEPEN